LGLIEAWRGAEAVWLVDAVSSDAPPGTLRRFDAARAALPDAVFRTSTHHVGVAQALELARVLGLLPGVAVVYGIEGAAFGLGRGLTPEVADAVDRAVDAVGREVRQRLRAASGPP
jgi:hydrogenase maturation protease